MPAMTRLEQIQARLTASTPGKWEYVNRLIAEAENFFNRVVISKPDENIQDSQPVCYQFHSDADGEFIAHAPADLEYLLRLVEAADQLAKSMYEIETRRTPCQTCGHPHEWRPNEPPGFVGTWASPDDGHDYKAETPHLTAQKALAHYNTQQREAA